MKLDIIVCAMMLAAMAIGYRSAFVFAMIYCWLEFLPYQHLSAGLFNSLPVQAAAAIITLVLYISVEKKELPRAFLGSILVLLLAGWITVTSSWAYAGEGAWIKWNWAVKVLIFASFLPLVLVSRERIEGLVLVLVLSIGANAITAGAKTLLSGGGYGYLRTLVPGNSGLGEGSTLAAVAAGTIPLVQYFVNKTIIIPQYGYIRYSFMSLNIMMVASIIGTHARAGLVALAVLALFYWFAARRKMLYPIFLAIGIVLIFPYLPSSWLDRMATTAEYAQEGSAAGRLVVWAWTWEFAKSNPFGGGFNAYIMNRAALEGLGDKVLAYHNIFFEMLGDQGYVGLVIFGAILLTYYWNLLKVRRQAKSNPELAWAGNLATSLVVGMTAFLAGSQFVANGFQSFHYVLLAISIGLRGVVHRELSRPMGATEPGQLPRMPLRQSIAQPIINNAVGNRIPH